MDEKELRHGIVEAALALNTRGLSKGTSGNVSARSKNGCLITPSGVPYTDLNLDSIVEIDLQGGILSGTLRPSSEWPFHTAIYRARDQAGSIVHCHSLFATVLAVQGLAIPAFHYMVAAAGGVDIRCAEYATFGTIALSENVITALEGRKACLMAQHGQVAFGSDIEMALGLAETVEELAAQYWHALQIAEPPTLSEAEMAEVLEKFTTYGVRREPS